MDEMPNGQGEFAIAFGDPADIAVKLATAELAETAMNQVRLGLANVKNFSLSPIQETIDSANGVISECFGCSNGSIDNQIGTINLVIDKCHIAIRSHLQNSIEHIGAKLFAIMQELPMPWLGDPVIAQRLTEQTTFEDMSPVYDELRVLGETLRNNQETGVNLGDEPPPPLPRCPDGTYAQCPSTATMTLVDGEWKCISGLDGREVDMICDIGPGGGGNMWECADGHCVISPAGTYTSKAACEADCIEPPDDPPDDPPEPGEPGTCTDQHGNTTTLPEYCQDLVTHYECVTYNGEIYSYNCTIATGGPGCAVCVVGQIVIEPPIDPPPPPPPDPPTPTPDPIGFCVDGFFPPAHESLIKSTIDTFMYWSHPSKPDKVFKLAGILNCLKDGTVEFVCNGAAIWWGNPANVGTNQGTPVATWMLEQFIDDDGVVVFSYYNESDETVMWFNKPQFFYFLQFGRPSDVCEAEPVEEEEEIVAPASDVPGSFCDPKFAQIAKDNWETINNWGDVTPDKINALLETAYETELNKSTSWWEVVKAYISSLLIGGFSVILYIPMAIAKSVSTIFPRPENCKGSDYGPLWYYNSLLEGVPFLKDWLPVSTTQYLKTLRNYNCQTGIPSPSEIQSMYNQGHLTKDEWEFGLKMHGLCMPWQERIAEASEQDFSVGDCTQLLNAKKFTDDEFKTAMNEISWKGDKMLENVKYLGKVVPSVGELFEVITRDLDNKEIIDGLKLDDLLEERNIGQTKEWMDRHGMSEEVLKVKWRLHWKLIDQRVVLRLYVSGQATKEDMVAIYGYNGHPPAIAEKLANAVVNQYWKMKAVASGKRSLPEIQKDYIGGHLSRDQFESILFDMGCPYDQIQSYIDSADERWAYSEYDRMFKSTRRAFMRGELDLGEYRTELEGIGMDAESIPLISANDHKVRDNQNKPIMIAQLCKLVGQGYMSVTEYIERAQNLGYHYTDATLLAQSCTTDLQKKFLKDMEAEQRKSDQLNQKALQIKDKERRQRELQEKKQRTLFMRHRPFRNPSLPVNETPVGVPDGYGGFGTN